MWSTDQPCENVVGEVRLLIANLADQEECSVRLAGHLQEAEAERDRLRDALGNAMVALRNATDGLGDQRSIDEGRAMVIAYCSERKAEEALAGSREGAP